MAFQKLKDFDCSRLKGNSGDHKFGLILEKTLWILSIGRNALVVFTASVIAFHLQNDVGTTPFLTAGKVVSGLPNLSLPTFSAQVGNQTYSLVDMCRHLGSGMIIVPLVGVLTNVAIAKAFGTLTQFFSAKLLFVLERESLVWVFQTQYGRWVWHLKLILLYYFVSFSSWLSGSSQPGNVDTRIMQLGRKFNIVDAHLRCFYPQRS